MTDPYARTTHDGKVVDEITHRALLEAERRLGYSLTIVKGSYVPDDASTNSAGTHAAAGVVDLAAFEWDRKVRVLRSLGFAAWYRTAQDGPWNPHIHAVLRGNAKLSPSAARQVESYDRHRDGLKYDRRDTFTYHPNGIQFYMPTPFSAVAANWDFLDSRDDDVADGALILKHKPTIVLSVEAKDRLIKRMLPGYETNQVFGEGPAAAGPCVAWDPARASLVDKGMTLGVQPGAVKMLTRWISWADLDLGKGDIIRAAAVHLPPKRYSTLWLPMKRNVAAFVRESPHPVLLGGDWNRLLTSGFRVRRQQLVGTGIDGFAASPSFTVTGSRTLTRTRSDHDFILARFETAGGPR